MTHKCKSCRSLQELSNEHFLAKFGADTAEKGPLKVCKKSTNVRKIRKTVRKNIGHNSFALVHRAASPPAAWRYHDAQRREALQRYGESAKSSYATLSSAAYPRKVYPERRA